MRAAVNTRYGPPEVVRVADIDAPTPGDGELLVRVHATTVNRTDCAYRAARPFFMRFLTGLAKPKATVLGTELAGVVEGVGRRVTSFEVGDKVFAYVEGAFGAHAELATVPEDGFVATVPDDVPFATAAASTEGSHYALSMIRRVTIGHGRDVLVNGATGAIGSAAVQLAKSRGANVTATCATPHIRLVRDLGADRVIDYTAEDFTKDPHTYDVVIDAVGKSSFARCRRLLKPGGAYLSSELGRLAQNPILSVVTPLLGGRKVVFPIPMHDEQMVRDIRQLVDSGDFTPLIDRRYPLDRIVEAYRYVETGQKVGNVVITLDSEVDRPS